MIPPPIHIDNNDDELTIILQSFAGYLKSNLGGAYKVFFRGQNEDYAGMVPSLFRGVDGNKKEFEERINAYENLTVKWRNTTKANRFGGEIGGALLQHYGIRTPWIDLVDNLFIALWFACHKRTKIPPYTFCPRKCDKFGWVYFLQFENPVCSTKHRIASEGIEVGKKTKWCDLRSSQTSLSLRTHVQHGIFGTLRDLNYQNYDLNNLVIASVKFPITKDFLDIVSIPPTFLFPSTVYDNTYKYLLGDKFKKLVEKGFLGQIVEYKK